MVGLGNIAHQFIKDLMLIEEAEVIACASRSLSNAQSFARQYGVPTYYGDYQSLFEDEGVDIVYIATTHNTHAELGIAAMDAGKHVLCEKPLAVNAFQVSQMIQAANNNGVFMMEAFWTRFNPSIIKILDHIKAGAIGTVNYINADFTFYRDDSDDSRMLNVDMAGGSLLDMGVYPVFLAYLIMGIPEHILATARLHTTGADLQTAAIFKYPIGIADLMSGFCSESDMSAKIYGTNGKIFIDPIWHETQGFRMVIGKNGKYKEQHFSFPTIGKGFTYEIQECHKCIQKGQRESLLWSHQNSLELITLTDEIRRQSGIVYPFEKTPKHE